MTDFLDQLDDMEPAAVVTANTNEPSAEETAWLEQRRGKITCSNFRLLGSSGSFSQTAERYLNLKVAERLGSYAHGFSSRPTEWGKTHEGEALAAYAERQQCEIDAAPFRFIQYSPWIGGTPDALVREDGCVEAKCPYDPAVHIETAISQKVPSMYLPQCDGHLLVTECDWCDFVSFDPRMPAEQPARLVVLRVHRDEARLAKLSKRLDLAVEYVHETLRRLGEVSPPRSSAEQLLEQASRLAEKNDIEGMKQLLENVANANKMEVGETRVFEATDEDKQRAKGKPWALTGEQKAKPSIANGDLAALLTGGKANGTER